MRCEDEANYSDKGNKVINSESNESEMDEGGTEVDWEGMYENLRSEISRLMQEGKYKNKEFMEGIKKQWDIPLNELMKIVRNKYESIGRIKAISDVEAVKTYVNDKEEQEKCLMILKDIRNNKMNIVNGDEYSSKDKVKAENCNEIFSKAAKQAIEANDLPSLKVLSKGCILHSNNSIQFDPEEKNCSLLEYSCKVFAVDCALYLIEEGGGIEQKFEGGETPLAPALRNGNEEISIFLIERGANIETKNKYGITPLHYAAAWNNCYEVVKLLIERGADVKVKDKYGKTPLHYAIAWNNCYEVAILLIERGADVKAKDKDGKTPLYLAAVKNSFEVAQLLIKKGADIDAKDSDGWTPLHRSAVYNSYDVAKLLIDRGADIEAKNEDGITPLHRAAWNNCYEVAKLLIDRGADLEAKNKYGWTPLHLAAIKNCYKTAKLLIERGADIKAKDNDGEPPLYYANNNNIEVARPLIQRTASLHITSPKDIEGILEFIYNLKKTK